mgnify:CR=1 FL=1
MNKMKKKNEEKEHKWRSKKTAHSCTNHCAALCTFSDAMKKYLKTKRKKFDWCARVGRHCAEFRAKWVEKDFVLILSMEGNFIFSTPLFFHGDSKRTVHPPWSWRSFIFIFFIFFILNKFLLFKSSVQTKMTYSKRGSWFNYAYQKLNTNS